MNDLKYKGRKYAANDWILVIVLFCATTYNAKMTIIRLIVVFLLLALPFILYFTRQSYKSIKGTYHYMLVSALWVGYFVFWVIYNFSSLELNFSGPNVEMMTPFLFISTLYTLPVIANYDLTRLSWCVNKFLKIYLIFLMLDVVGRFILEPNCFMNYSCRFDAKTVGYYSTTNALASSLIPVLLAVIITHRKKLLAKSTFAFVMVSSMARAAIVAYIIAYSFCRIVLASTLSKVWIIGFCLALITYVLVLDPLNFGGDGSGKSKVEFFLTTYLLYETATLSNVLVGFGANFETITTTLNVNGWSPHAPALKGFLYFGVIGLFLHLYSLFAVAMLTRFMIIPVIAFVILGLAGAPLFFPTFFTAYAILRLDTQRKKTMTQIK